MEGRHWLEFTAALMMCIGVFAVIGERWHRKKGIGVRVIQLLAVLLLIPTVLILALESILSSETVGTLLGAVAGYILSGIGKDEPSGAS